MKRWLCVGFLCWSMLGTVWSAGMIIVDEANWWPGPGPRPPILPSPWPPDHRPPFRPPPPRVHLFAPLEITREQADVRIKDQVAETTLEQEFLNPNDQRMEGSFLLPLPAGAQLQKFSLEIDGKPVEAELLAADKARGIYEDIVRKLKDPALLEYSGRDVYRVRVFPMEPHARRVIRLSYQQVLKAEAGLVSFQLPLGSSQFSARAIPKVRLQVELETRRPLKSVYSPTHEVQLRRDGPNRATVSYEAREVQPEGDFQLYYAPDPEAIALSLLTHADGPDDGYFLMLLSPGVDANGVRVSPKDVVFVLDTSGSMAGAKLEQARKALLFCIENLNPDDRFEVIRFSTEVEGLFQGLVEANSGNRGKARAFAERLRPTGGTAIDEALRRALAVRAERAERPGVVVFLTDGLPTVGTVDPKQILDHVKDGNRANLRVFCFGIGHDVNTHLLDGITEVTRGSSQYVLPEEDLEVKVSSFFAKIREPVLVDPKLEFSGGARPVSVYPNPLPDLFAGEQLLVVGRYRGHGSTALTLSGNVEGRKWTRTHEGTFVERSDAHAFLPRLWATRRVGYLLDQIRLNGENAEVREEVTDLARTYGIVTPYTAWLIVEDERQRAVPLSAQSLPQLQQDAGARALTSSSYDSLRRNQSGEAAVASARYGLAMKAASAPAAAQAAGRLEANRAMGGLAGPTVAGRSVGADASRVNEYTAQTRFAGDRAFFWNGQAWVDGSIQKLKNPRRVTVAFGSAEYFDLVKRHPELRPWLALGSNVQFALGSTVYEVQE